MGYNRPTQGECMKKMPLSVWSRASAALLAVCVVGLLSTCGLAGELARRLGRELRRPDPEVVQAAPSGLLSRHAALRVVFTRERADRGVGELASPQPFSFMPPLAGSARWTDERTLEFTPARPMPAGRSYTATVRLPKTEAFDFSFSVMQPRFDVAFEGLEVVDDSGTYRLDGTVQTADKEEPARIEQVLRASLGGRALGIRWMHGSDPLLHPFSITGIERASGPGVLAIAWSGRPIGGPTEGRKDVGVPSRRSFEVLDMRAGDGEPRCIEIGFSDSLDDGQDLAGLVRVTGREDVRQSVIGNRLRLFSLSAWKPSETVTVDPSLRRADGASLVTPVAQTVAFKDQLPQVKFAGSGVIVPTTQGLTVPIETMNLRAVIVEAFQVFGDNMTQFLQVNSLDESEELYRVGAVVWRKVIPLPFSNDQKNSWIRHGLDLTPLVKDHPDGMFQIRVSFRQPHVVWNCQPRAGEQAIDQGAVSLVQDDPREQEASYWDSYQSYEGSGDEEDGEGGDPYSRRNDPCSSAYYLPYYGSGRNVLAIRNVLVSNIGLIAKAEPAGDLTVFCTDLRTAQPLPGVKISLQSFQRQQLATGQTDKNGMASFRGIDSPSFIVAERSGQYGWLKVDGRSALVTSHFDTGGEIVKGGVKGFLYGERGIWRPGDPIYLTFILSDPAKTLPAGHPVTLELRDPRGQSVSRQTKNASVDGFYAFTVSTDPEAPTGSWEARVRVGDRIFSRDIRVESIMPNRVKILFDVPAKPGALSAGPFQAAIQANWLHGAPAANLKASILLRLTPTATSFAKYGDYVFDDPTRAFSVEDQNLFDGALDSQGKGVVTSDIEVESLAPGKLSAGFSVRVFEESGAFSAEQFSRELSPYKQYVGIRVPKGDAARGMLLVDTDQAVRIVLVDSAGNPIRSGSVQAELYKLEWRWWWEKGEENLADFASSGSFKPLKSDRVSIANGEGEWKFQIKYPDWGRYLVRVRDLSSGHATGKIVYIDWPGWAGRAMEGKIGATMLTLATDKTAYTVGETVTLTFPSNPQGRALVSLEQTGKIIRREWVSPAEGTTRFQFTTTADMAPNIYAHVTFLQPHQQTANDLPIRLFGVVPVFVQDPATHLRPAIQSADVFKPGETVDITVKEAAGREMTYTLAMVDEGLLRINRFSVADPWTAFYRREASQVVTWDLYDYVAGAFAGKLERLLAVGGGEDEFGGGERKASRFPPIVKFFGPVSLKKGGSYTHSVEIPQYVGAVRLMVVAGHAGAYGAVEKEVVVKSDLMVLSTLPRVLSVGETVEFPVTLFNTRDDLKAVTLGVSTSGPVTVAGSASQTIRFTKAEERIARFSLNVGASPGVAKVRVSAESGSVKTFHETEIGVRIPATRQTRVISATVQPGKAWQEEISLIGAAGTNAIQVEVSRVPPLDLGRNLTYLVTYPHGCVEQTTSAAFPQLFLDGLMRMEPKKAAEAQRNIDAAVARLAAFQAPSGGFAFWPGSAEADEWATSYAGHFLLEAQKRGFVPRPEIVPGWIEYQKRTAGEWEPGEYHADIQQAYRLYTLALAGEAELGAMNRLRELRDLSTAARWRLAAAYFVAGQKDEARRLVNGLGVAVEKYRELAETYGSDLRDRAAILECLVVMGMVDQAEDLANEVSRQLASSEPYGTQSTAFALLALSEFAIGTSGTAAPLKMAYSWAGGAVKEVTSTSPILVEEIPPGLALRGRLAITNTGSTAIYPRVILQGIPPLGTEKEARNWLELKVDYEDPQGASIEPDEVEPGSDLIVTLQVTNLNRFVDYEALALSYLLPGSWEVANARVLGTEETGKKTFDYQDIRDDRILTYFALARAATQTFQFRVTSAYSGRFYLPSVSVEAMYDSTIRAVVPGKWLGGR